MRITLLTLGFLACCFFVMSHTDIAMAAEGESGTVEIMAKLESIVKTQEEMAKTLEELKKDLDVIRVRIT